MQLAEATAIVRNELVESIRPALLLADATPAARTDAAIGAVFRVMTLPGTAQTVAFVAGVWLDDELKRSIRSGTVPLPPRAQLEALAAGPVMAIESLLNGGFSTIVGGSNFVDDEAEQVTAGHLADEALRVVQSHRGRACVAYLCGLQAGAILAESREGAA
ncbi:MAG: hypothetical protein AAGL98_08785 [Planctomycetota bacterium]